MAVPLLDLKRQWNSLRAGILPDLEALFESQLFVLGKWGRTLEEGLAAWVPGTTAVGCANGSDALFLALLATGIGPGDGVITSAFTFFATGGAVVRAGARPLFADIGGRDFNLDPDAVESFLQEACIERDGLWVHKASGTPVRALMPVHLYGQPADMDRLADLAARYQLVVVEDMAQALGAKIGERPAGTWSEVACTSFFPSKNLGAAGDAGMMFASDPVLVERLRRLRVHGSAAQYRHSEVGINSRLDEVQALVLVHKSGHLPAWTAARRRVAEGYRERLAGLAAGGRLTPPEELDGRTHVYHQFTVRIHDGHRDAVRAHLAEKQIGCQVYYPVPLHRQPCFEGLLPQGSDLVLPRTEHAAAEVLSLPIFPELTEPEMDEVCAALAQAVGA